MKRKLLILQEPGISPAKTRFAAAEILPGWKIEGGNQPNGHSALITVRRSVDREMLKSIPGGIVSVAFTGYDHIDIDSAREFGVAVCNVPGYSTRSVSELAFALTVKSLRDSRREYGIELSGKVVGILGTGEIGVRTAELFKAAGCKIIGWSRTERSEFPGDYVDLEELFSQSDILSVHLPLNSETRHFLNRKRLEMMKKGAVLVNTARGGIVDQNALTGLLQSGHLGGAALDVTTPEPLPENSVLRTIPGVIISPHMGYNTSEALQRRTEEALMNISAWQRRERRNRVD
ncbi:hydroxyacid dehydrogenase [Candidatus Fermentibacteria bacterium]|nr:MAG: hydroxyacid dehydrogenase [Candidatus Fermentibacteria bacterium]